jgi:signal transduction histidine kinase
MTLDRVLRAADVGLVLLLAASALTDVASGLPAGSSPPVVHAVLALLITLPLLVRRRWPLPVATIVATASLVQYSAGGGLFQPWFAMILAVYALGAHAERRISVAGLVPVGAAILAVDAPRLAAGAPFDEVVPVWAVTGLVWLAGRWVRRRREEATRLRDEAARAVADRDARAAQAVAEERARVARELHDLVAHSMSVVNIQAQGARRVLRTDPDAAAQALDAIDATSRRGLNEMRRLLSLLRTSRDGLVGADDVDGLAPQPGLADLVALVDQSRAAGLDVSLAVDGERPPMEPDLELAAYRIVQESLTNAVRHGHAGQTIVRIDYGAAEIGIQVSSPAGTSAEARTRSVEDGVPATPGGGQGLTGMRERVRIYGGSVEAGPDDGGRFVVRVRLPTAGAPA